MDAKRAGAGQERTTGGLGVEQGRGRGGARAKLMEIRGAGTEGYKPPWEL